MTSVRAKFAAAMQYRTEAGVEVADAFAFMSALYFRGKIAYARQFAVPSALIGGNGIFVITSGYGLVPPDWRLTEERMKRMRRIDIDADARNYTKPLREHAQLIAVKDYLDSDEYVEYVARNTLGLVRPGETLVVVTGTDAPAPTVTVVGEGTRTGSEPWWWELFVAPPQ